MRLVVLALVALMTACGPGEEVSSAPSLTPIGGCADPVKCSTPPPAYTPYAGPSCDAPLTTIGDADEWLVPTLDGQGGATAVIAVGVRPNGRGCAGMASGWFGPFPRISAVAARSRMAALNDPVASIDAVYLPWNRMLPPSSDTQVVWRAVRQSGHEVFLFGSGDLYEGGWVRAIVAGSAIASPKRYAVATAADVLVGMSTDPFVVEQLRYLRADTGEPHPPVLDPRLDRPLRVVGAHKPYTIDLWIVPIRDRSDEVVAIIDVAIGQDGLGSGIEVRGWSGTFPRIAADRATLLATTADDPAVAADLAWAEEYYVSPGGPVAPGWLVTRRSGAQVFVSEDALVVSAPK